MKIPKEIGDLIESGCLAHLVTLNRDGSPQVTCIWIGLDGEEVVAAHLPHNQKVKNIEHDARVAISLETHTKSSLGFTEYAVLYGHAHIEAGGAPELLQKLAYVYIGPASASSTLCSTQNYASSSRVCCAVVLPPAAVARLCALRQAVPALAVTGQLKVQKITAHA